MLSTAQRNATYPTPNVGQRVENIETQAIERWTGTAWVQDIISGTGSGGGTASLFAINATFDGTNWRAIVTGSAWVIWQDVAGNLQIGSSGGSVTSGAIFVPVNGMEMTPAGVMTTQTQASTDNSTRVATTAFVQALVVSGGAPINSPNFTGIPTAPTASPGTNTTQLATTAFVTTAVAAASGAVTSVFGRTGAITATSGDYTVSQVTGAAPLASPTLTGTPLAPTPGSNVNTTQIVTGAWVNTYFAPLASAALTGVPTAPTAASGTNTTQLATTAFVQLGSFIGSLNLNTAKASGSSIYLASSTAGTTDDFSIVQDDNGAVSFKVNGTTVMVVSTGGNVNATTSYQINGTKVLGARITGFGTPTGSALLTNFPGASATLAQTTAMMAYVVTQLENHGLFGA